MFSKPLTAAAVATSLAFGSAFALPLAAQPAEMETAPAAYSDESIAAFAQVALEVAAIRDQYAMALAATESETEQQQIVEEGNAAMLAAVEESPAITLDEYLEIGEAAAVDPELGERIAMVIEEMTVQQQ